MVYTQIFQRCKGALVLDVFHSHDAAIADTIASFKYVFEKWICYSYCVFFELFK